MCQQAGQPVTAKVPGGSLHGSSIILGNDKIAVVTHDILSARRVADYINVLWKGRIVEAGPAEDMLNSDNPFIRQFLAGESEGPLAMD